jgi:hypothetical protein
MKKPRLTPEDVVLRTIYRGIVSEFVDRTRYHPVEMIDHWAWALHFAGEALGVKPQPMTADGMPLNPGRIKQDILRTYEEWNREREIAPFETTYGQRVKRRITPDQNYATQAYLLFLNTREFGRTKRGLEYTDVIKYALEVMQEELQADLNPVGPEPEIAKRLESKTEADRLAKNWYNSAKHKQKIEELDARFPWLPSTPRIAGQIKDRIYFYHKKREGWELSRFAGNAGELWDNIFGRVVSDGKGGMRSELAPRLSELWHFRVPIGFLADRDGLEAWLSDYVRWCAAESFRLAGQK